jgi:hypothetical protein
MRCSVRSFKRVGLRRSIVFPIACTEPFCIVFQSLLRIAKNLMRSLNRLKFGDAFRFSARVAIRVVLQCWKIKSQAILVRDQSVLCQSSTKKGT